MNTAFEQLGIEFAIKQQRVDELEVKVQMADEKAELARQELAAAILNRDEAQKTLLATAKHIAIIHPQDK